MTSWEKARELVDACLPLVPHGKILRFGRFEFDGKTTLFGYRVFENPNDERHSKLVTASFLPEQKPSKESFSALALVLRERTLFLLKDLICNEPPLFNKTFPAFHYWWAMDADRKTGKLVFFRIDFSNDDFINYGGSDLHATLKEGNEDFFSELPDGLAHTTQLLGRRIPRSVDYENMGETILRNSELEVFSRTCGAVYS